VATEEETQKSDMMIGFASSKLVGFIDLNHSNKDVKVTLLGEGEGERSFTVAGFGKEFKPPVRATGVVFELGEPFPGQSGQLIKATIFGCD
jgi:hypothetical protein